MVGSTYVTADPVTAVYPGKAQLCEDVAARLLGVIRNELKAKGSVHIALTGGSVGIGVLAALHGRLRSEAGAGAQDFGAVHIWWGDARLLPERDAERNAQQAAEVLLEEWVESDGLPAENVHAMPSSENAASPEVGAQQYAAELARFASAADPDETRRELQIPEFSVVLLGVGPDGHIASLFPGKEAVGITSVPTVGEGDSPKPPPERVSLTVPVIQSAQRVWTVVAGEDKAQAVAAALSPQTTAAQTPAVTARGRSESLWHLDTAAASLLPGR